MLISIVCLVVIQLLVGYRNTRELIQGRGKDFGQLLAVVVIQTMALLIVLRAYNRMSRAIITS